MKKEEMITLLRSAGVDENAVTLAVNAWELGAEEEREACALIVEGLLLAENAMPEDWKPRLTSEMRERGKYGQN
jgi:hypothetical protein